MSKCASLTLSSSRIPDRSITSTFRTRFSIGVPDWSIGWTKRSLVAIVTRYGRILAFHGDSIESLPGKTLDHALISRSIVGRINRTRLTLLSSLVIEWTI